MTQSLRIAPLAAALVLVAGSAASAQRGSRGTMGAPRTGSAPSQPAPHAPAPTPSGRGQLQVPRAQGPTAPHGGDLPRVVMHQGSGYYRGSPLGTRSNAGSRYNNGSMASGGSSFGVGGDGFGHRFAPGSSRRFQPGYTRVVVGGGCIGGCFRVGFGGRFFSSFFIRSPLFVPIFVPYFYSESYQGYVEQPTVFAEQPYVPAEESSRAASKLIVIGGSTGNGGDALTIETVGDSVRLSWLGAGRAAREVKLFVADSAQHQLATRSASPSAPTATFEVSTLSSPVAFAGVTVTFADGVTTTTTVPYRSGSAIRRSR